MRKYLILLLACTMMTSLSSLAQSKPDRIILIDGTSQKVVIKGENRDRQKIQYYFWESDPGNMRSVYYRDIHKILYSYGAVREFNPLDEEASVADDIFGDFENEESYIVPDIDNNMLVAVDETQATLLDFSWTKDRLKILRPDHYVRRRRRRSRYSSSPRIRQWEEVEMDYVKGVVVPGQIMLAPTTDVEGTLNDSTGWIQLLNGLRYAANSIEVRDDKVNFVEYYTRKVFEWNIVDVTSLIWEGGESGLEFIGDGDEFSPGSIFDDEDVDIGFEDDPGSRGDEEDTISDILSDSNTPENDKQSSAKFKSTNGKPSFLPPASWPLKEASTQLSMRVNSSLIPSQSTYSLFPRGKRATTLGDVKKRLDDIIQENDYIDCRYYAIPGGFLMMTPIEKFLKDGSRPTWYERNDVQGEFPLNAKFPEMVEKLALNDPSNYRMLVFVVTDQEKVYGEAQMHMEGQKDLPASSKLTKVNKNHKVTFMVYEWSQLTRGKSGSYNPRGRHQLAGFTHLDKSGLWELIQK
ncbi:MAG: hypothetical protein AAFY71_20020 [Bacteroidota bacterium]